MDDSLIGKNFGTLKVVRLFGTLPETGDKYWVCACTCGKFRVANYDTLGKSGTITCGRHKISKSKNATKEYRAWKGMKERCYSVNSEKYKHYGARGIIVCERWIKNFSAFFMDMGLAPSPKHSVDRIDVNGNYEPLNCRWATAKQQQNNRRNNKKRRFAASVSDNSCEITSLAN